MFSISENPGLHLMHLISSFNALHISQWATVAQSEIINIKYLCMHYTKSPHIYWKHALNIKLRYTVWDFLSQCFWFVIFHALTTFNCSFVVNRTSFVSNILVGQLFSCWPLTLSTTYFISLKITSCITYDSMTLWILLWHKVLSALREKPSVHIRQTAWSFSVFVHSWQLASTPWQSKQYPTITISLC